MSPKNHAFISKIKCMVLDRYNYVNEDIAVFIACLSALETSYGLSLVCRENHNLFGMKCPKVRLTTSIGENRGHAKYISEMSSICDFFYWLQYNGFNQRDLNGTLIRFIQKFREKPYNPSIHYVDTILKIMSNFNSYKNE